MTTPILGLEELSAAQAQPHVVVNANFRALEVLSPLCVQAIIDEPTTGQTVEGARFIVGEGAGEFLDQDTKVAYYASGWHFLTPQTGWLAKVQDEDKFYEFTEGSPGTWGEFTTGGEGGGGGGEAGSAVIKNVSGTTYNVLAADETKYMRLTNASAKSIIVDPEATEALPDNGEWHFRNVGAGDATIVPGTGVTVTEPAGGTLVIPQNGTVTLKRVGEDEFELVGQTVAA